MKPIHLILAAVALASAIAVAPVRGQETISSPAPSSAAPAQASGGATSLDPAVMQQAVKFMTARRYREAFELLEPAASAHPEDKSLAHRAYIAGVGSLVDLFKAKKYAEVVSLGDHVSVLEPDDYQSYFTRARALEELKRTPEAVEQFRKARERSPKEFVARALANACFLQGDYPASAQVFEELVTTGAAKGKDFENLGAALYKAGDVEKALLYLNKALEISPGDTALASTIERLSREHKVQANYATSSNAHFDVLFENTPAQREIKENLLRLLEQAYDVVTADLQFQPEETVQVVIYPSGGDYREASEAPTWSAAVYDGKIRIPTGEVHRSDEALQRILQHEFTHLLVEKMGGRKVPAWLNEGIAQAEEKREAPGARALLRQVLGNKNLRGNFVPLENLHGTFIGMAGDQARLAYAEAYFAVQHMLEVGGMWSITSMLGEFKEGAEPEDALKTTTGYDYAQFQKKWLDGLMADFHLGNR